jgi:hypothetical protein
MCFTTHNDKRHNPFLCYCCVRKIKGTTTITVISFIYFSFSCM